MRKDSLWLHRDFRLLWASDTISQFGTTVGSVAIPLLAATALAATPWEMGLLTAAEYAGFLLIGLPAGAWVDRLRRRPLMISANLCRTALLFTLPVAWWAGWLTLTQLIVVALAVGVCTVFFDIAYQSYLPTLVSREHLVEGNGALQASQSVANVSGPALGGGLVQLVGAANATLTTGLGYLASGMLLWRIRTVEPQPERERRRHLRSEIAEGLRFVLGHPLLRAVAGCTATWNLFSGIDTAVGMLFLSRDLGLSAGVIGLVSAGFGAGGMLGALTARKWTAALGQARAIWVSMLVTTPFGLLIPIAGTGWRVALYGLGCFGLGYGTVVYNVAQVSFRQTICSDRLLGRMNATMRFLVWGTLPLGGLAGGMIGEWIGVRGALWVASCGYVAASGWLLASPLRGLRDLPTDGVPQPAETVEHG
jgi:MFS family permease